MKLDANVLIIGGGLAGLTCAIHLGKLGHKVLLIEKNQYPHHKVCGEYISNEVMHYLKWLELDIELLKPTHITKFQLTTINGKSINAQLPLGGFGISRYAFDEFLFQKAKQNGCTIINDTVVDVKYKADFFDVSTLTQHYTAKIVLGAYGKRATLDHKLNRSFINHKSNWLAIKAHYKGQFPSDLVALHNFKGGYCGISKVENDTLNICYLVSYETFKKHKDITTHRENILFQNIHLKEILVNSTIQFEAPLTISQIAFENKEQVKNHVIMIGDTAGLIHPLCGNGMSMAIHSAKIAATLLLSYLNNEITTRAALEQQYIRVWKKTFSNRLFFGRLLASILKNEKLGDLLMKGLIKFPSLLPIIIKKTHGKPLTN
ncbi:NAD(P)/FAD-dependent oxidoreductase [Pedobacter polaris]|uniref:NAD(P)/FAD-dependent oxidoreductase n=1 Tax=Pedobacter polaris TaxID=2571273 RepID=A0A4U1CIL6_9SPHI|nr:NAD(P)/FAD-dependent oxidoreductase [Pedobacter polaris]TKC06717.1 NAD(P)/FAD-dependent oxidoreductase [Pedobacter polaris]